MLPLLQIQCQPSLVQKRPRYLLTDEMPSAFPPCQWVTDANAEYLLCQAPS